MTSYCKKHILPALFLTAVSLFSCSTDKTADKTKNYSENRTRMEAEAQKRLAIARRQLAGGQPTQAKQTIEKMRTDCYLALDGRNEGILLMDSVDLALAKNELASVDSLMRSGDKNVSQENFDEACRKVQFYERKIQYDRRK